MKLHHYIANVREFHERMGLPIPAQLTELGKTEGASERLRHMREELAELHKALSTGDVAAQVDALVDLEYLILGTAISMGIRDADWVACELAVHAANMRKERLFNDPTGHKQGIIKPEGWQAPNLEAILESNMEVIDG